jgi:nicotinamidase-related amidase
MTTALLVIDVQRALFDPLPRPFEADAVVSRINALTARARAAGVPVVFVRHESTSGALAHGTEGWTLASQLTVEPTDHRVRKTTPDAFLRTDLSERLAAWGVDHVVLCGYATEFCVDTTARRAAALGLTVTLAADAHTTHDKPHANGEQIRTHHNATLPGITSFGPRLTATSSAQIQFDIA